MVHFVFFACSVVPGFLFGFAGRARTEASYFWRAGSGGEAGYER